MKCEACGLDKAIIHRERDGVMRCLACSTDPIKFTPAEQAEQVEKKYCLIRPSGESPWMTLSPCDLWNHVEAGEEDEVWEVKWVMMTPKEVADLPEWEGW